jgi:glyoxylase-like metal-dependent hydrolase (beta-lactamase superfamily II)
LKRFVASLLFALASSTLTAQGGDNILVTKINDTVFRLYVSDYVYMYAFHGNDGTLLIDTGYKVNDDLLDTLKAIGCHDVKYVINTHSNGDHIGGNHLFADAVIMAHSNCRSSLEKIETFPPECLPDLTFGEEITLYLNSETIQLIPYPGAHTDNDVIVCFVNANLVFLGDLIVTDSFPVIWVDYFQASGVDKLISALDAIIRRFPDDAVFVSSHGRDYSKTDLRNYQRMVVETVDIIQNAIKDGKTLEEIRKEDLLKAYRSFDNKRFEFINADFWTEIIYKDFMKRSEQEKEDA